MMTFQVRLPAEKGMQTGVPVLDFLSSQALIHTCLVYSRYAIAIFYILLLCFYKAGRTKKYIRNIIKVTLHLVFFMFDSVNIGLKFTAVQAEIKSLTLISVQEIIMKTISLNASFSDVSTSATQLGLELSAANIGFELWEGESYRGGFGTLSSVISELNSRIETDELRLREKKEKFSPLINMLAEASVAAILDNGTVIGSCRTDAKRGATVAVFNGLTAEGIPVNVRHLRISRSAKNLAMSREFPEYTPQLIHGDFYYAS
ncbi:hypothetical protein V6L80_00275 (plasmid) [Erwinia persicina]|uniref:hypothetical protein n=1 Tax=Erwinia persicina TaxID=55211 RepID=UPI0030D0AA54